MDFFKYVLLRAEIEFDECKKMKKDLDSIAAFQKSIGKSDKKMNYYSITYKHMYKYQHLWVLLLKSIVNDMPMTYYLSICKKLRDHLYECVDVEGMNEGEYLEWTASLKERKEAFDEIVDDYTEYKISMIKK